jgi:hypothetical protein
MGKPHQMACQVLRRDLYHTQWTEMAVMTLLHGTLQYCHQLLCTLTNAQQHVLLTRKELLIVPFIKTALMKGECYSPQATATIATTRYNQAKGS